MAIVKKAGDSGSWPLATSQATAKEQLSAALDGLRQLIGAANIAPGSSESTDPLTAPFVLYVNPYIGRDTFAAGSYNTKEAAGGSTTEQIVAQKLKRLENQRFVCGYTRHAPFKTITRARIEAAIITSKNWYINDPLAHVDCVVIVLAPGLHIDYTNPSSDGIPVTQWADGFEPTWQHLVAFNPAEGGTLNPRGCSILSEFGDLRHTIVRPSWVPNGNVDEAPTYFNGVATYALRRQMWKVTGGGYAYGITFMDKLGYYETHHLLSVFGHATKAELDEFYGKVWTACGSGGNLSQALLAARGTEYTIAAPISGTPTEAWDSTASASFYIFQCSIRSNFGLGRLWNDGSKVLGFKSFVCANFTGVSLQKSISEQGDMRCWQKYSGGNWVAVLDYQDYISQTPDNIRMNPARRSVGVGAINEGFVQKVSIFDIGEGAQSFVDTGGEIDSNGGNSSFGGCAGLAKGYRRAAFPNDRNWQISAIKVPLSPEFKTGNIQRFYLGTVAAFTSSSITLSTGLAPYGSSSTVPDLLGQSSYSLPGGSYIWVENPQGTDWRAQLTGSAWSSATPAQINISAAITDPSGGAVGVGGNGISLAIGARVYVRRLVDVRIPAERRLSIKLSNTTSARIPSASAVLQVDASSSAIARPLSASNELLLVTATGVGDTPGAGVIKTAEVTLRRGGTPITYTNNTTYRAGTVVLHANKHYINSKELTTANSAPDPTLWQETYVHMESNYAPEDNLKNEAPILIFDTDTDGAEATTTCGINWATIWGSASSVTSQYRTGTDYLGAFLLLSALGYGANDAHAALVPRAEASRSRNPALTSSPATTLALSSASPSGGAANAAVNWPVEFRRPSTLWMGGHRWFGSGAGNYSKAVPTAAQDMSAQNRFTYYFTSQGGGRVIPQGSQEDGLLVSPRGLEDTTTGQTLSVESIGAGDINTSQGTNFPTLSVGDLTVTGSTTLAGPIAFADSQVSQTTRLGPVKLAPLAEALKIGSAAPIATADTGINAAPEAVTVPFLNAWKNANQLVSALTGELIIYVDATKGDRNLAAMLALPPTQPANAIPSLARAAEYANEVLAGSETTAVVRIAASGAANADAARSEGSGHYFPNATWTCKVRLEAWNNSFTAMPFPSFSSSSTLGATNFFAGEGYDDATLIPQFIPFRILVRSSSAGTDSNGTRLQIACSPYTMAFQKSVEFKGGFAFLGLAEVIRWVAGNVSVRAPLFIAGSGGEPLTSSQILGLAYSTNTATNVDSLLRSVRETTAFNGAFSTWISGGAVIQLLSRATDLAWVKDCIFGPGLPSHKENLSAARSPYIDIQTEVPFRFSSIHLRGNTVITSNGIGLPSTGTGWPIENSNVRHYGSALQQTPWTFRQFYHTFIGCSKPGVTLNLIQVGRIIFVRSSQAPVDSSWNSSTFRSYFKDLTGKYLPNHIHLVKSDGTEPAPGDVDNGPFVDQFIHAPSSITIDTIFANAGIDGTAPASPGFVGRFGSNGHNNTKARGILLGNQFDEPEGGTMQLSQSEATIWIKAGASASGLAASRISFITAGNTTTFGQGFPAGANPVITTTDSVVDLNVGGRSWKSGIDTQYGSIVRYRNVTI